MSLRIVATGICQISKGTPLSEFEKVATDSEARILQFSEPLSEMEVKGLESIVFSNRPDITLRVFGHYGQICDLSFLLVKLLQSISLLNQLSISRI